MFQIPSKAVSQPELSCIPAPRLLVAYPPSSPINRIEAMVSDAAKVMPSSWARRGLDTTSMSCSPDAFLPGKLCIKELLSFIAWLPELLSHFCGMLAC